MLLPILNRPQREKFDSVQSVDFGYGVPGVARFRANLYMQRGTVGAVFRRIPIQILGIDALELPIAIRDLAHIPDGLVLVTGPTGSGKSTTLAAMISDIARTSRCTSSRSRTRSSSSSSTRRRQFRSARSGPIRRVSTRRCAMRCARIPT